jgi:dTDP-4-dehydrorhamnose reductase
MDNIRVVDDQIGKPTYTADLAGKISEIVGLDPGIYHVTNDGECSWYEYALSIVNNVTPCSSEEYMTKVKRPAYSILCNTKTTPMRNWKIALDDYLREIEK